MIPMSLSRLLIFIVYRVGFWVREQKSLSRAFESRAFARMLEGMIVKASHGTQVLRAPR